MRRDLLKAALILTGSAGALPILAQDVGTIAGEFRFPVNGWIAAATPLGLGIVGLALTLFAGWIGRAAVRWIVAVVAAVSTGLVTTTVLASDAQPTFDGVAMALDSLGALGEFVGFNPLAVIAGGTTALLTVLGVGLRPVARSPLPIASIIAAWLAALSMLAVTGRAWAVGATAPAWSGPALAIGVLVRGTPETALRAPPPALWPVSRAPDGDVILIVDESVDGHYLDLNRPHGVRSGLVPAPTGVAVANFGIAASAANFSAGSNYILRTGGTRASFLRRRASIWAYAQRAGYRTVHLFAQTAPGLQNLMTATEAREVDRTIRFDRVALDRRDQVVAATLAALMHDGVRQFVYVNKIGAHFPAWRYYPAAETSYRPVTPRTSVLSIAAGDAEGWRRYRNDYRNVLRWNVGRFFDRLLADGMPRGTTILYTSDHGEAMREGGAATRLPHGNVQAPSPAEGAVPLVVLTPASDGDQRWREAAARTAGTSHFRIFPTLLGIFGYDRIAVAGRFGPDLLAGGTDPMTFNSRFYSAAVPGQGWHRITPADLPDPVD